MPRPLPARLLAGTIRRTVWLMLGAAIGLAAVLVAVGSAQLLATARPALTTGLVVGCLLLIPLIGLIPGVRELEVTAGRSLLQPAAELVAPDPATGQHRRLTVAWATAHLTAGLLTGLLLIGLVPGSIAVAVAAVRRQPIELAGRMLLPAAGAPAARLGVLLAAGASLVVWLGLAWALGVVAARIVPRFLGPTASDRLALAEARLATEAEHAQVARDLHDGIGHALTIISVQAAAGRRAARPEQARETLEVVEHTARQALSELDAVLGLLRDGAAEPRTQPGLSEVAALVAGHRRAQLPVTVTPGPVGALPTVVSCTAYRVVAEALTNAQRYGGTGTVHVSWGAEAGGLVVEVRSPLPARPSPRIGSGHGLDLLRDRVGLLGGRLRAGPREGQWVVRAELPTPGDRSA